MVVVFGGFFVQQSLHSWKMSRSHFMVSLSNNDGRTKDKWKGSGNTEWNKTTNLESENKLDWRPSGNDAVTGMVDKQEIQNTQQSQKCCSKYKAEVTKNLGWS